MSTNEIIRRRAALQGAGQSVDWEELFAASLAGNVTGDIVVTKPITKVSDYGYYSRQNFNSFTLPDTVTQIGTAAFSYCRGMTAMHMGNGVKSIGGNAFANCNHLTSITIPATCTSILQNAFQNCTALTEMIFVGATPPTLSNANNSLGSTSYTFPIYVPDAAVNTYKNATSWANYASRVKGISERPT